MKRWTVAVLALSLGIASGCRLDPPPPLPAFDCAAIDRAPERFPEECADAGEPDAGTSDTDAG
jgi:hypothetical protein